MKTRKGHFAFGTASLRKRNGAQLQKFDGHIRMRIFVTPNHTVFNIEGNTYRLIVKIEYRSRIIFINTVLTHVQYDKGLWK